MKLLARLLTKRAAAALVVLFVAGSAAFVNAQQQAAGRLLGWRDNGGGPDNTHFVNSTQITKANVSQLQVAWTFAVPDNSGSVFNPVVVDDMMFVLGRSNALVALNATTGKVIWVHEGLNGIARRGINYWESADRRDRRLLLQVNHTLQAIDAQTGNSIVTFGNNGFVDLRDGLRREHKDIYRIQSNNPGKVFENLLILGSVTGEGYMSPPGDLRAFDVRTGKLVWQFHSVPHPGEYGYETWPKEAWKYVGGVNTWGELSIDAPRGIAYFPTGSGTYDFYGADRHGLNLFANSLIALDARTGKRLWHQQLIHHDLWDYDLVSAPQLMTLRRNGQTIPAVAQATKHGHLYVFNRVTGAPIFPIDEKPVPASDVRGEEASPTQPVQRIPPFAKQTFTVEDINPYLPPDEKAFWTDLVSKAVNKGLYTPPAMTETVQMPGNRGGSNWGTTSANPNTGMAYVMSINAPAILKLDLSLPGAAPGPPNAAGGRGGRGAAGAPSPGEAVYQRNCQACHGANRQGAGAIPSLNGVVDRLGIENITDVISNGRGQMPAFGLADADMAALLGYLANPTGAPAAAGRGRGAGPGPGGATPPAPIGPVAGLGGAPAGVDFVKTMPQGIPQEFGAHGGPAYPDGLGTPTVRYYTGWNVMRNIIAPPWSTLTAYDLNRGTIKWQIPIGEDPRMVAMGVRNTGIQQEQRAVLVTPTGLLFASTSDGYLRALDADTGQQIWSVRMPGNGAGIPAMYEVNGRAYIVVPNGGGGGGAAGGGGQQQAAAAAPADGPVPAGGYVVYALPRTN